MTHLTTSLQNSPGTIQSHSRLFIPQNQNNFALQFDGSQNYVDMGTLGTFGSSMTNGVYCSFDVQSSSSVINRRVFGIVDGSSARSCEVEINYSGIVNQVGLIIQDNGGNRVSGYCTYTMNDNKPHSVIISSGWNNNSLAITIDKQVQSITIDQNGTLGVVSNFTHHVYLANFTNSGSNGFANYACILDNFKLGTSSTNLFVSYNMEEGKNTTLTDLSGHGNNGTLIGSPLPTWVSPGI